MPKLGARRQNDVVFVRAEEDLEAGLLVRVSKKYSVKVLTRKMIKPRLVGTTLRRMRKGQKDYVQIGGVGWVTGVL